MPTTDTNIFATFILSLITTFLFIALFGIIHLKDDGEFTGENLHMNIKDKAKQYERAEITIVALHEGKTGKKYNIYSLVELCPDGQMKSPVIGNPKYSITREKLSKDYTLYIRRVFFDNPLRGVSFFQSIGLRIITEKNQKDILDQTANAAQSNDMPLTTTQVEDGDNKGIENDDVLYDYGEMISEPDGEEGILFNSSSAEPSPLKPILPVFTCSVRVYTQLSKDDAFQKLLTQKELGKAGLTIKKELGISLLEHMEYWGSVFLCLPNPFVRNIRLTLGRDRRFLLVYIQERTKQKDSSIRGGIFEITDERPFGTGFCLKETIIDNQFFMEMPNEPERLRYRLFTPSGAMISDSSCYFMKSIDLQIAVGGQRRIFRFDDQVREMPMNTYENLSIGDKKTGTYLQRLKEEEKKRSLKYLEKSRTFVYFPGNKEDPQSKEKAVSIIQEIIGKAKKLCIICDPYLSASDFITFGICVTSLDLVLHLITSEAFLIQPIANEADKTQGDTLIHVLNEVKDKFKVQCHVLQGRKTSPLHDRFIIVDKEAYLLGSSLSEFGARATTLYKVPNPDALEREARKWIYDKEPSINLQDWAKKEETKK